MFGPFLLKLRLARAAIAGLALIIAPICALAADAANGEIIAKRWCAACHLVSPGQALANSDVPSFKAIALEKSKSQISDFLTDPHPKMPDMNLSRGEIADIAAYIDSLGRAGE
jgi:mono/diheme cytochrome c family protein